VTRSHCYDFRIYAIVHENHVILNEVKNLAAYRCDSLEGVELRST
jgi:hypothetical protein